MLAHPYYTPEEYLTLEESAESKSEYHDGLIIPMAGGTTNHNQIAGNIYIALSLACKQMDYRVYLGDVRLWISAKRRYTYPDVMVIAGKPEYHNNRRDTVINPQVIVEILSNSTQSYDRDEKFRSYRSLPTFQEYVLVDQSQIYIEQFVKTEDRQWTFTEYSEEDRAIVFNILNCQALLSDIYEKVDFDLAEEKDDDWGEEA